MWIIYYVQSVERRVREQMKESGAGNKDVDGNVILYFEVGA